MKAMIEIELQPFTVPNFVIRKPRTGGDSESFSYGLDELDPNTLDRLCSDFRREVFKKAGKNEPPREI